MYPNIKLDCYTRTYYIIVHDVISDYNNSDRFLLKSTVHCLRRQLCPAVMSSNDGGYHRRTNGSKHLSEHMAPRIVVVLP